MAWECSVHFLSGLNLCPIGGVLCGVRNYLRCRAEGKDRAGVSGSDGVRKAVIGERWRSAGSIEDGVTGYLVSTEMRCNWRRRSKRSANPEMAREMGRAGQKKRVRTNFDSMSFAKALKKSCASYANPECDGVVRPFYEFCGPPAKVEAL